LRLGALPVAEVEAGDDLAAPDSDRVGSAVGRGLDPARLRLLGDDVGAGGEVGEGVVAVGIRGGEALAGITLVVAVVVEVDGPARWPGFLGSPAAVGMGVLNCGPANSAGGGFTDTFFEARRVDPAVSVFDADGDRNRHRRDARVLDQKNIGVPGAAAVKR